MCLWKTPFPSVAVNLPQAFVKFLLIRMVNLQSALVFSSSPLLGVMGWGDAVNRGRI